MFEDVRTKAKAEGKIPLLIIKEKSKHGELVVMDIRDFQSFKLGQGMSLPDKRKYE